MKPLVQLVILGAGVIGQAVADLVRSHYMNDWDVVQVDPYRDDVIKQDGFEYAMNGTFAPGTYFLNTMPIYDPDRVFKLVAAITAKNCHYLDISEDLDCSERLEDFRYDGDTVLIAPHCGLAPGLSTILAANLMRKFTRVESCQINVGALPVHVANPFGYVPTWSPEGLINEYQNESVTISDHELVYCEPDFSNIDKLWVNGIQYETCKTSGGLGTMCKTLMESPNRPRFLEYRTIRYPGHWALVDSYWDPNNYEFSSALKKDITSYRALSYEPDRVIIHIEVQGESLAGVEGTERFTSVIEGTRKHLAIQKTTAYGPLLIIDSHAKRLLPSRYLPQEEIELTPGIKASPFYIELFGNS